MLSRNISFSSGRSTGLPTCNDLLRSIIWYANYIRMVEIGYPYRKRFKRFPHRIFKLAYVGWSAQFVDVIEWRDHVSRKRWWNGNCRESTGYKVQVRIGLRRKIGILSFVNNDAANEFLCLSGETYDVSKHLHRWILEYYDFYVVGIK